MLPLLFLLKFPVLWSFLGDHSILLHSFPFTNTIKCKIGVFKPDFLPTHNRRKKRLLFQKTRKKVKLKLCGEHTLMNQFVPLSSTLNLQGAPQDPLLPAQRDSRSASAPGAWNTSRGTGIGSAGCAAPAGPGISQRSLGRRCNWAPQDHCEHAGAEKHKLNSGAGTRFCLTLRRADPDDSAQPPTNASVCESVPTLQGACLLQGSPSWAFCLPPLKYLCGPYPQHRAGKLPDTMNRLGQQGWSEQ